MNKFKLNTVVIGCGNIGSKFDHDRSSEEYPLTHIGAFIKHGGFNILGCIDTDEKMALECSKFWGIRVFKNIQEVIEKKYLIDVVSICTPTSSHFEIINNVFDLNLKAIFCEKPISLKIEETRNIEQLFFSSPTLFSVNYSRRWDPMVNKFRNQIHRGDWGEVRSVMASYNKGLLNNGSHMLDLLSYFFGKLRVAYAGPSYYDFWSDDPSIPAMLFGEDGLPICMSISNASDYSHFELEIITEKGAICMENGGAQWRIRPVVIDQMFGGYKTLGLGNIVKGTLEKSMFFAVQNLYNAVIAGEDLSSSASSALVAQELCANISKISMASRLAYE